MITLSERVLPAEVVRTERAGSTTFTLTPPGKLKVQTTGPGAATHHDEGPPTGKSWAVRVHVEIVETAV